MGDFGSSIGGGVVDVLQVNPFSGASANSKGSWYSFGSSTVDAEGFTFRWGPYANIPYMFDVAVGSTGNIVLSNLYCDGGEALLARFASMYVAMEVPAGTTIYVRCQATLGNYSAVCAVLMNPHGSGKFIGPISKYTTYGAVTATTLGTAIDSGGTANVFGSWYQLVASAPMDIKTVLLNIGNNGDTARANANWTIQIGVGSSGNEEVIGEFVASCHSNGDAVTPNAHQIFTSIPSGTRITVRAKCTINTAGDRVIDAILVVGG